MHGLLRNLVESYDLGFRVWRFRLSGSGFGVVGFTVSGLGPWFPRCFLVWGFRGSGCFCGIWGFKIYIYTRIVLLITTV